MGTNMFDFANNGRIEQKTSLHLKHILLIRVNKVSFITLVREINIELYAVEVNIEIIFQMNLSTSNT